MSENNRLDKFLGGLSLQELGSRLRAARVKYGFSQEQAANLIGVARTTIVAIEQGSRIIKPYEFVKLLTGYGQNVGDFLRSIREVDLFGTVQFRGPEEYEDEKTQETIEHWIEVLKSLAYDYYDLEQLLGKTLLRREPQEYSVDGLSAKIAGESIALEERQRMGLSDRPIMGLREILEREIGARIYYLPIRPSNKYGEIYIYSEKIGCCLAVNSAQPVDRQRFSLAHGYGHFLTARHQPMMGEYDFGEGRSKTERVADMFAVNFLMPESGIKRMVIEMRRNKNTFDIYDMYRLSLEYGVSFKAMLIRLEDIGLIKTGTTSQIENDRKFSVNKIRDTIGVKFTELSGNQPVPIRQLLLAAQAVEEGLISEAYAYQNLSIDPIELRNQIDMLRQQRHSHTLLTDDFES